MRSILALCLLVGALGLDDLKSETIKVDGVELSIIKKGETFSSKPTIVLLSGPTDNWHSDLAWWILGQNYLSEHYNTIAIERANQGFSQKIEQPSYTDFAKRFSTFITKQPNRIIVVAFASSNLSVQIALSDNEVKSKVQGVIFLDPDVLTEHSIHHYTQDTENYRKNWQQLSDYIKSGKYQERAAKKVEDEKAHLKVIISKGFEKYMDWNFYEDYENIRKSNEYQWNKFKEVTVYKDDLQNAYANKFPKETPLVILDSDFESGYLTNIKDEKVRASIIKWRDQGKQQFFELAKLNKCNAYWPVDSQEHLLTFTELDKIKRAIERIEKCQQ